MGENGTPEPRTRGEDEPDSSMDEGLEVDLHVARCSFSIAHRATNLRNRTDRSPDRTDDDQRPDDGCHRSDPMTLRTESEAGPARERARARPRDRSLLYQRFALGQSGGERARARQASSHGPAPEAPVTAGSPTSAGREPEGRSSRSEREWRERRAWCEPGPFAGTSAPRERRARPNAPVSGLPRRGAGSTRSVRGARASRTTALEPSGARRTPVPARAWLSSGDEPERELRPDRGATPGPRMDASTWPVEDGATGHAERELRTSKRSVPRP